MKYSDGSAFLNHYLIRKAFMGPWKAILREGKDEVVFSAIEQKLNMNALESGELVMSVPYVCFDCIKVDQ